MNEENRSRGSTTQLTKVNINNPLFCPHDLTKCHDFRDDLPTLLGGNFINKITEESLQSIRCNKSKVAAFNDADDDNEKVLFNIMCLRYGENKIY